MIKYLTVSINPPPLDTKLIVKKAEGDYSFDDMAKIHIFSKENWSEESAAEFLIGSKLTLWAVV